MNQNEHESEPAGSPGTSGRGEDYLSPAGIATTQNRDVRTNGNHSAGTTRATRENEELRWARRNVPDDEPVPRPVRKVFRKTELHGTAPPSTPDESRKVRCRTLQSLKRPDCVVSYQLLDAAFRDFICSLMERQDMMGEELFFHIAELQQQINELEQQLETIRQASSAVPEPGGRSS